MARAGLPLGRADQRRDPPALGLRRAFATLPFCGGRTRCCVAALWHADIPRLSRPLLGYRSPAYQSGLEIAYKGRLIGVAAIPA